MLSNRKLFQKAQLSLSDLLTDGGALQPAQAKKFIEIATRRQKLSGMITVKPLRSFNEKMDFITFSSQVLYPGVSGEALPEQYRSKPTTSDKDWDAKKFKAEVRIPEEVLEDNIEGQGLRNTIMRLASEAVGRDAEKVAIQGDTTSADVTLAVLDGFLKQSTTNQINGNSARFDKSICRQMLRAMPKEFLDDRANLRYFTSINAEDDYSDSYAPRATELGDKVILTNWKSMYKGIPIEPIPLFPETYDPGAVCTNVLLTNPKNLVLGIWRQIRIRTREDIEAEVFVMVVSMRFDVKIKVETATVKTYAIVNN